METKQGVIKRRLSRIKGVCYIPGGETPYNYVVPTMEETASVVLPFITDDKNADGEVTKTASAKIHEYIVRGMKRDAKLVASGGLDSTVKKDSAFSVARNGINTMLEGMQKTNPDATIAEAAAVWFAIPGMKPQLESEGVVFGEPDSSTPNPTTDGDDDDDDE